MVFAGYCLLAAVRMVHSLAARPAPEEVLGKSVRDLHLWMSPADREALVAELAVTFHLPKV